VVKKKNSDDIRLCVNYKKLNDVTVNDPMAMPEINDILTKIGQSDMFSTVDMSRGYYAIGMTDMAKDYTTFCTGRLKMREWKMRHGQKCKGGKCRSSLAVDGQMNLECKKRQH